MDIGKLPYTKDGESSSYDEEHDGALYFLRHTCPHPVLVQVSPDTTNTTALLYHVIQRRSLSAPVFPAREEYDMLACREEHIVWTVSRWSMFCLVSGPAGRLSTGPSPLASISWATGCAVT